MTFEELQEAVRGNISRTDKDGEIARVLNESLREIARSHRFTTLDSTADLTVQLNEEEIPLPDDLRLLDMVRCDGRILTEVNSRELERLSSNRKVKPMAKPRFYAMKGSNAARRVIQFWPIPNGQYDVQILYSRWPAKLVQPEEYPEIDDASDILIALSTAKMFMHLQLFEEANMWFSNYHMSKGDIIRSDSRRPSLVQGGGPRGYVSPDPQNDPFVRRMR